MNKRTTGLYNKFTVTRTDGKSEPGQKHDGCEYFVLDMTHDKHAYAAIVAYAGSCEAEYPLLARDLRQKVGYHGTQPLSEAGRSTQSASAKDEILKLEQLDVAETQPLPSAQDALRKFLPSIPCSNEWHANRYDTDDSMVLKLWRSTGETPEALQYDCPKLKAVSPPRQEQDENKTIWRPRVGEEETP